MKNIFKRLFIKVLSKFLYSTQDIAMPWTKKILHGKEVQEFMKLAQPGDLLLVRAGGYLSTLLMSLFRLGKFSHVAYVSGNMEITDATGVGVAVRPMAEVLVGYTRAVLMRPKFTKEELKNLDKKYREIMAKDAKENIVYNYKLLEDGTGKPIPDSMTCCQFGRILYNGGREGFLELRSRFGFLTISPDDFYAARSKFDMVKEHL